VVADLRLIPVVPDGADASQDFVFGAPVAPPAAGICAPELTPLKFPV